MSGAAQLNHHEQTFRLIKARKEKELTGLLSKKDRLSVAETVRVKELMGEIR